MRRRANTQASISLFPFLAVLLCTMGSLILLMLGMTQKMREQRAAEAAADAESAATAQAELASRDEPPPDPEPEAPIAAAPIPEPEPEPDFEAEERARAAQERRIRETWLANLAAARSELSRQKSELHRRKKMLKAVDRQLQDVQDRVLQARLKNESAVQARQSLADAEKRLIRQESELAAQIAQTRRNLDIANRKQASAPNEYALVPYDGKSGSVRHPVYVECTDRGFRFLPEGETISPGDLEGFGDAYNPLLTGTSALLRYWKLKQKESGEPDPYVLLLVRPSGSVTYYEARKRLAPLGANFGYELVEENWKISTPDPDPVAKSILKDAIAITLEARGKVHGTPRMLAGRGSYDPLPPGFIEERRRVGEPRDGSEVAPGGRFAANGGRTQSAPGARPYRDAPRLTLDPDDVGGNGTGEGAGGGPGGTEPGQGNRSLAGGQPGAPGGGGGRGRPRGAGAIGFGPGSGGGPDAGTDSPSGSTYAGNAPFSGGDTQSTDGEPGLTTPGGRNSGGLGGTGASGANGPGGGSSAGRGSVGSNRRPSRFGGSRPATLGGDSGDGDGGGDGTGPDEPPLLLSDRARGSSGTGGARSGSPNGGGGGGAGEGESGPDGGDPSAPGSASPGAGSSDPSGEGGATASQSGGSPMVPMVKLNGSQANRDGRTPREGDERPIAGAGRGGSRRRSTASDRSQGEIRGPRLWGQSRSRASIGLQKDLEVHVFSDRILIGPDDATVLVGHGESNQELLERVAQGIEHAAENWGEPPANFYWLPRARFTVFSGGQQYYERLHGPLQEKLGVSSGVQYAQEAIPGRRPAGVRR